MASWGRCSHTLGKVALDGLALGHAERVPASPPSQLYSMARRASSTGFSVRWTILLGLTFLTGHTSGTLGGPEAVGGALTPAVEAAVGDDAVGDVVEEALDVHGVDPALVGLDVHVADRLPREAMRSPGDRLGPTEALLRRPLGYRDDHRTGQQVAGPDPGGHPAADLRDHLAPASEGELDPSPMVREGALRGVLQHTEVERVIDACDERGGSA